MKRAELRRVTPLRQRSRKLQQAYNIYLPLRRAFLEEHPWCQRCPEGFSPSVDVHHKRSRARGCDLTDTRNWAALCRDCHSWFEEHPRQAEAEGYMLHSWDENPRGD